MATPNSWNLNVMKISCNKVYVTVWLLQPRPPCQNSVQIYSNWKLPMSTNNKIMIDLAKILLYISVICALHPDLHEICDHLYCFIISQFAKNFVGWPWLEWSHCKHDLHTVINFIGIKLQGKSWIQGVPFVSSKSIYCKMFSSRYSVLALIFRTAHPCSLVHTKETNFKIVMLSNTEPLYGYFWWNRRRNDPHWWNDNCRDKKIFSEIII